MNNPPKVNQEHVASSPGDVLEAQVARLREVFPDVFVEGKIDWDKLRITLGAAAESGPGRFHFSWAGKDDAVSLLQTPSAAMLIPCPEESVNFDTSNALRESEERFRALTEQSTDIILIADHSGQIKYASPSVHTVLAIHEHNLVGTPIVDLVHLADRAKTTNAGPRSAASGQNSMVEFRLRHADKPGPRHATARNDGATVQECSLLWIALNEKFFPGCSILIAARRLHGECLPSRRRRRRV